MPIQQQEFELLRDFIEKSCGILVGDEKSYLIESRLTQLMVETGAKDFHEFYLRAKNYPDGSLRDKIVDAMTTNETSWFRDEKPWKVLEEVVLPAACEKIKAGTKQRIRVWSAASSTGQEAYSLVMLLDRLLKGGRWPTVKPEHFEVVGTDISPSALFLATAGRYNRIEMARGLPEHFKSTYFEQRGAFYELKEPYRKRASFRKYNLQESLLPLGRFDIVFCRNVAIYFSDAFKRELFAKIAAALNPEGVFFLGSSESLMGYSEQFERCEHKQAIYYQVKGRTQT